MSSLNLERPQITDIQDPVEILRQMLAFRRSNEKSFSVMRACQKLVRTSPTLISLILKNKRKVTPDRIEDLSRLMGLSGSEKLYFKNLVMAESGVDFIEDTDAQKSNTKRSRKNVSTHILSDWLHVYVKDCFHLPEVQKNPELIYAQLGSIASNNRIKKSLQFLLINGYLRRTEDNKIIIDTNLTVTDPKVPSQKIRNFHKAALNNARQAIDLHSPAERYANTLLVNISKERYQELCRLTQEFAEKLQDFADLETEDGERLYQLVINISPVGGKVE